MACTSCGIYEHFDQQPASEKSTSSCPGKDLMNNCLYTAQGTFVCNKDDGASKGTAKNTDMALESFRDNNKFKGAAPMGSW